MTKERVLGAGAIGIVAILLIALGALHVFAAPHEGAKTIPEGQLNPIVVTFTCQNSVLGKHYAHFTWTNDTSSEFLFDGGTDYFTPTGVVTGNPPYAFPVDGNKPQQVSFLYTGSPFTWVVGNSHASTGAVFCQGT